MARQKNSPYLFLPKPLRFSQPTLQETKIEVLIDEIYSNDEKDEKEEKKLSLSAQTYQPTLFKDSTPIDDEKFSFGPIQPRNVN